MQFPLECAHSSDHKKAHRLHPPLVCSSSSSTQDCDSWWCPSTKQLRKKEQEFGNFALWLLSLESYHWWPFLCEITNTGSSTWGKQRGRIYSQFDLESWVCELTWISFIPLHNCHGLTCNPQTKHLKSLAQNWWNLLSQKTSSQSLRALGWCHLH